MIFRFIFFLTLCDFSGYRGLFCMFPLDNIPKEILTPLSQLRMVVRARGSLELRDNIPAEASVAGVFPATLEPKASAHSRILALQKVSSDKPRRCPMPHFPLPCPSQWENFWGASTRKQRKRAQRLEMNPCERGSGGSPCSSPQSLGRIFWARTRGLHGVGSNPRKIWATGGNSLSSRLGQIPGVQYFYLLDFTLQGNLTRRLP